MNYIIEDEIDFFKELNKMEEPSDIDNNNIYEQPICMITHMPLIYNSVKLLCGHQFNYLPLYKELVLISGYNRIIKCPYCRTISNKLLPYIPLTGVEKKYGINSPKTLCMVGPKCLYKLKNGKNKGSECAKDGIESKEGIFCKKHFDLTHTKSNEIDKIMNKTKPTIIWTTQKEDLFKRKSVIQLKQLLKEKGMKTTGLKKELVNRIFIYNNANDNNNVNDIISLL